MLKLRQNNKPVIPAEAGIQFYNLKYWILTSVRMTLLILGLLFIPKISVAADLKFGDKTWTTEIQTAETINAIHIRNDFEPKNIALSTMVGKPLVNKQTLL